MEMTKALSGAVAAAVALSLTLAGCGSDKDKDEATSSSSSTSASATSSTAASSTTSAAPTSQPKVAPREENAAGPNPTIATYIKENNITETPVKRGDPGAPDINLPMPEGWADAGPDTPEWAYGAIVYTGPEAAQYTPSIVAIVSKLTGNVDPQKVLDLSGGELKNLEGFEAMNSGEPAELAGFKAYQISGTWMQGGQKKLVAQKTVVIPKDDAVYVLQLNTDSLENQIDIVGPATTAIDADTKITA